MQPYKKVPAASILTSVVLSVTFLGGTTLTVSLTLMSASLNKKQYKGYIKNRSQCKRVHCPKLLHSSIVTNFIQS